MQGAQRRTQEDQADDDSASQYSQQSYGHTAVTGASDFLSGRATYKATLKPIAPTPSALRPTAGGTSYMAGNSSSLLGPTGAGSDKRFGLLPVTMPSLQGQSRLGPSYSHVGGAGKNDRGHPHGGQGGQGVRKIGPLAGLLNRLSQGRYQSLSARGVDTDAAADTSTSSRQALSAPPHVSRATDFSEQHHGHGRYVYSEKDNSSAAGTTTHADASGSNIDSRGMGLHGSSMLPNLRR